MRTSPDTAKALYELGMKNISASPQEAVNAFLEALHLYRQLAEEDPDAYLLDAGTILNNLGNLYCEMNRMKEAEEALGDALRIRYQLARSHPGHLPDLAMTWHNLGRFYHKAGPTQKAEQAFEEAAKIYRGFTDPRFSARLLRLTTTLDCLADLYLETRQLQQADKIL